MKILIIGGGVIGLTCAWRLASAGAQVELFDARACGHGATLAALGALWPASPLVEGPLQQLHRESLWQFESFLNDVVIGSGMDVTFRRLGRLELLNSPKAEARAREEAAHACANWPAFGAGPTMEILSPEQVVARQPGIAPPPFAALLCRATAQVHVPELLAALLELCRRSGVKLHEHTRMVDFECTGGRISALRTVANADASPVVTHAADAFLVTAGAWTPLLDRRSVLDFEHFAPVRPVKGQGLALAIPPGVHLETILKSSSIYLIPWHKAGTGRLPAMAPPDDGEILVGSTTEPDAGYDEIPTAEARATLLAGAAAIVPALRDAPVLRHWAGLRPQNPHKPHPPIMGPHPAFSNLFVCTAHYKTGIGLAPLVSSLMTTGILQGVLPPSLIPFLPAARA